MKRTLFAAIAALVATSAQAGWIKVEVPCGDSFRTNARYVRFRCAPDADPTFSRMPGGPSVFAHTKIKRQ
jgi:hypothetical protein